MNSFIANRNSKWTNSVKVLGLLLLSVLLTKILWSTVSFTELTHISRPSSSFAYLQLGAISFNTLSMGHLIFVLSLFLFGSKQEFVMKQLMAYAVAHTITLWLSALHFINVSAYVMQTLVLLTTIYIAGENITAFKLKNPRIIAVFVCGLIHGVGMSANLQEVGFGESNFQMPLVMYNVGIELAFICFAAPAFILLAKFAAGKSFSKVFMNIISASLVVYAAYLTIQQLFIPNL
ncbi:HupE/UreJ family protein [Ferruginibacter lapsinanis]|uniref:HupE/UreJ family protein n=1 Tax=Ferruginibacter lapsinanis TaxID=563172 RepID=UPI001E5AF228|nr:HupE/UreJ family protein [Ferruginibacter lapsinanis]UEG49628.1 HupE/UreJ family protein [Ferruginibacter lapsinanis]